MMPHEVCAECRRWFEGEAEGLPEEIRQWVLRALTERHERLCCDRLFELRDEGRLPAFWNTTLEKFWEGSR
jgi:hypothetical protein